MRPKGEFDGVMDLVPSGLNDCQISRQTAIPRGTVRDWRVQGKEGWAPGGTTRGATCPICDGAALVKRLYAYLLGLYLGDGCLSKHHRGVFRLRIVLDLRYPDIIAEGRAIAGVCGTRTARVSRVKREGCIELSAYWKHWRCIFPQHGPGKKHLRRIELADWQAEIVTRFPDGLLRGLIHSDGCRHMNRVKHYAYPRYEFTNFSTDIRDIFCRACDLYGVSWKLMNWKTVSIARAPDVAKLDLIVGPKS